MNGVKITRGTGELLWLETDTGLVAVNRVGGYKTENYAHTLYRDASGDTIYDVVRDTREGALPGKWISRTYREVK